MHGFWMLLIVFLLVFLLVLCVVFAVYPWSTVPCTSPSSLANLRYDCVVAAYRENLNWLHADVTTTKKKIFLPGIPRIIVYSKHEDTKKQWPTAVSLPNVGRCDHTYLYHIVNNYDNLAERTLFVTGSAYAMKTKRSKLQYVIFPRMAGNRYKCMGYSVAFFARRYFVKKAWRARFSENFTADLHRDNSCVPASIRPYGKWWDAHFKTVGIPFPRFSTMSGLFVATRDAIRNVPLDVWKALLQEHEAGENLEVGHFMELSWYQLLNKGHYFLKNQNKPHG